MKILSLRFKSFALSILTIPLLVACNSAPENAANQYQPNPKQEEVKNYIAINCPPISNDNLERNVATLASSLYIFKNTALLPHNIQLNLNGFWATGTSQMDNQIFNSSTRERLGFNDLNDTGFVKIATLVKMPTRVDKAQTLLFSERCQTNSAIVENGELGRQPDGAFYLLASKKSFIVMRDGTYKPEPSIPVKFKLLNSRTQQTEEATIPLQQIIGGDYYEAPSSVSEQILSKIQNLMKGEAGSNSPQWSINKQVKVPHSPNHPYFTVNKQTKEGETIEGEILSVEFAPDEIK